MNEDGAFLAAIKADPSDDTTRLVFADWLDERGRRGGEFIRAECALAAEPSGSAKWHEALARYRRAGEGLSEEWRGAIGRYPLAHWLAASARSAWVRLENWCRQHYPALLEALAPGATGEEIEELERAIGQPLPPDVRESFAIHNGNNSFIFGCELQTTQGAAHDWQIWRDVAGHNEEFRDRHKSFPVGAVALDYTNAGWVPLTRDAGGNHIGVDLAPGPAGTVGQVIIFGRDEDQKCASASGWAEFLADYATFLESGAAGEFDPNSSDPLAWYSNALGDRHPHDVLRKWRMEGKWPWRAPEPGATAPTS
ncbi:SMI1/KNR4 family protein [Gemmata sp. G18]|uniref:SMI1/KNR4 family protein n=1 Tax=Gemmata palustris TaxID=2822762 RepID=A0ABS5BNI0_9BACT|nr:TIGR02996 domain-containing protein [Gemmata palustris]MBP3955266.1 SMI1/KNR4 family protein [Gemmata palustris]